jgi:hypothetical protein
VSKNPGLARDAARQRGYGRLVPRLLEVRLIGGPRCGLRGHAAGILPRRQLDARDASVCSSAAGTAASRSRCGSAMASRFC